MPKSITMAQMAKELGVSQVTVSAVVNGREKKQRISPGTVKRVRAYLDQRGYVQSKSALQVRNGMGNDTVGILFCGEFIHYSYLIQALSYMSKSLEEKNGLVEIVGISPDNIKEGLRDQVAKGIRRLIWIHDNGPQEEIKNSRKLLPLLSRMDQVVIFNFSFNLEPFEHEFLKNGISLVGFDRKAAYRQVAEIYRDLGHSRIALDESFIDAPGCGPRGPAPVKERVEQFGFEVYGLCPRNVFDISDEELAIILAENLVHHHRKNQVNCAFIRNYLMGTAVINILLKQGFRVPEDIAIIGFGDLPMADFQPVPLTTFQHPVQDMCEKTLELISNKSSGPGKKYFFMDKFICRESHKSNDMSEYKGTV